jgi:spore germination protein KC
MTRLNKNISCILISIMMCSLLSGCFNYRDINKIVFITGMVIDVDDEDNVVLYTEAFKPFKGSGQGTEKGQRILFKGLGKTLFEAVRDANLTSSYKNNYTQNRAIIFSQKAAERGIDRVIDFLDRDQEVLLRAYVFVYVGDIEPLMKLQLKEEEYIGVYLYNLIQNVGVASRAVSVTFNQYMTRRLMGSKTEVIPVLRIRKESLEEGLELDGGAIMEQDKMKALLPRRESQGYNFLTDQVKSGTLEVTNPVNENVFVTLEILNSDTNTELEVINNKIKLKKYIRTRVTIGEAQDKLVLDNSTRKFIEKNAEENIRKYSKQLFEEFKLKDLDIFHIKEDLCRRYPKNKISNVMEATDLEIVADVEVEGSSNKFNAME